MDIEAEEASGTESGDHDSDDIGEELNEYDEDMSECSNYSTTIKSAKVLRKEKRDRAKKARKELWNRFGLTLEGAEEDQDDMHEEERRRIKRQKRDNNTLDDNPSESRLPVEDQPQVLKQTTLNSSKVSKSRKLFSRRELIQKGVLDRGEEVEEVQFISSGPMHRDSKK